MPGPTVLRLDPEARDSGTAPYRHVVGKLRAGSCVILDGATGTELPHASDEDHALDERLWGTRALVEQSSAVLRVHQRYVDAGCDVISTNTWGLPSALLRNAAPVWSSTEPVHWLDLARRGLRLARQGVDEGGRTDDCAVRLLDQRRRRHRGRRDHDPAARATVRRRVARSHPARDVVAAAGLAVRHRRAAARYGASGVALVPPMPLWPLQRVRAPLGRAGGRHLRARCSAL